MVTFEQARAVKELIKVEFSHLDLFRGGIGLTKDLEKPEDWAVSINVRSKRDMEQLPTEKNGVKIIVKITGNMRAHLA